MRHIGILLACLGLGIYSFSQKKGQPSASTLFTPLDPQISGITFNNQLEDTKDHNILIYSNFYGGGGVGIGDINNDGLADIYFAGNQVPDQLYLNKGSLKFEDISDKAGLIADGSWSSGVIFGDVNKDGWEDIYVTAELYDDQPQKRRNKLYINNQDNTFTESAEQYGVADTQRTRHATFLDYDKDGDLDLFLCNQPPNPGDYSPFYDTELILPTYQVKLLRLDGTKYTDVTKEAGLAKTGFPNSVTASDLNGDGWTDLYVANDFWIEDWLFLNQGDGTFTENIHENTSHISFSSMGVDAADINNDGLLDMMVLDMVAEDNYRLKANMSGMNPNAFWKVVDDGGHYQYMFNTLHFNTGDAYFSDVAQLANVASTDWSWSVLLADFDNDGWKDAHITNGLMRDIRNTDANKKFAKYIESALFEYLQSHPAPDPNLGVWDIVDIKKTLEIVPSQKLSNYTFRNNGDMTFSKSMEEWGLTEKTFSSGSAYADLDHDGDLEIIINHVNDIASIYENHASSQEHTHYLRIQPVANAEHITLEGTKIRLKTNLGEQFVECTSVRGMYSSSEKVAHFGLEEEAEIQSVTIQWTDGSYTTLDKVARDQLLIVEYATSSPQEAPTESQLEMEPYLKNVTTTVPFTYIHKENEFDDYQYQVLLPHKMSSFGPRACTGDVNGDGLDDLYIGGANGYSAQLMIQQENGEFLQQQTDLWNVDKRHEDMGSVFFDADNDGDLDLYVASGGNEFNPTSDAYQDRLYLNDGQGNFSKAEHALPSITISSAEVIPSDVDHDGDMDLFVAGRHIPWAYPAPATSTLLINDQGTFTDGTETYASDLIDIGMVNDAAWLDWDNDGWEDLIIVGEWMPITVLRNEEGSLKKMPIEGPLADKVGWFFSIETADIDADGDKDIVVGNLGLNYKYKASQEEPFEVYYYDFDDNGSKDVVLTYYNFGIQYPLRGRSCSSQQVPILKQKFESYELFADADVFDVYGEQKLENALHYEATDFASAYIENKGEGIFEWHALPTMAQFSSINDILIEDVNQDQHLDLLVAGNLYDAEIETARNDAGYGLLLLGDSKGSFKPISKNKSGFFVPYDVKDLSVIRNSTDKQIWVFSNREAVQVFEKSTYLTE